MEYTKGKWIVTQWASHNDVHVSSNILIGIPTFIANCGNPGISSLPHNPEALANAHLIAAAPDMYEALKKLTDLGRPLSRGDMSEGNKALAKAEGKGE